MNRAERRKMEKLYRHAGLSKEMAKSVVNQKYGPNAVKEEATATVKLNDGTEKVVPLGDVTDVNDPKIMEKVNEVLKEE